jgi:hypothetical protein
MGRPPLRLPKPLVSAHGINATSRAGRFSAPHGVTAISALTIAIYEHLPEVGGSIAATRQCGKASDSASDAQAIVQKKATNHR